MPKVAEFAGIVIAMYFGDHNPPHFHAKDRNGDEAMIAIGGHEVLEGSLRGKQLRAVQAWAKANQALLESKWAELSGGAT